MTKLMVIDDESDFCTLVKLYCNKNGVECKCATSIAEGMALVKEFAPDILILDNNLPDGYGWNQASFLLNTQPDIMLNLITAKNGKQHDLTNEERVSYYLKPLSLLQLDKIIHQH